MTAGRRAPKESGKGKGTGTETAASKNKLNKENEISEIYERNKLNL